MALIVDTKVSRYAAEILQQRRFWTGICFLWSRAAWPVGRNEDSVLHALRHPSDTAICASDRWQGLLPVLRRRVVADCWRTAQCPVPVEQFRPGLPARTRRQERRRL